MNVNRIDQSQKRLNYYSRSSPKKKKNTYYQHSPLLSSTIHTNHNNNKSHHSSIKSSNNSSLKIDLHEVIPSKAKDQILIQEPHDQEILIDDPVSQSSIDTRVRITDTKPQIQDFNKKQISQEIPKQTEFKANEIRIEDSNEIEEDKSDEEDNEKQVSHFDLQQTNKQARNSYIKIQNQQQQTMNRQFTFANQLINKLKYQYHYDFLPTTKEEEQYSEQNISQEFDGGDQDDEFHSDMPYFESNMQYQVAESMKKKPTLGLDISIMQVYDSEQYQSPKFNTISLRRMQDKWITAQDYHLISSPIKNKQILIQQPKSSKKSSLNTSPEKRPFYKSIVLIDEIMQEIPDQLQKVYSQMHKKLNVDQINAEQQLFHQQQKIKLMKTLVNLRKHWLKCQQFLLSQSKNEQQQIQINQIIIHSLIKRIISNKSES